MAKLKKTKEVAKFGGVDELGKVQMNEHEHDVASVEAQSQTKLEDDQGIGDATIIRCFTFGMNPEVIIKHQPTKQDLFNYHVKGIEATLWKDGMKLYTEVAPRITFDMKKMQYSIFVAARPRNGYLLHERPQTLSELAHG